MIHRIAAHPDALRDKDVLRAAVRRITGKLAERPFRLFHARENLAFDDDFRARRHLEIGNAAARQPIGLAEQTADDLELPDIRRVGINHRSHVMQRMGADRDRHRQRLATLLGAAVELIQAPA